jgi:hypothetical protein
MQYEKLLEFKRSKGHCMVPQSYEQDRALGQWVHRQRNYYKTNKLLQGRKRILDEIGFAWKLWNQQYEKLVEFQRTNGHCKVSSIYEQDRSLGIWVLRQRRNNRNNKLRRDRKELLDQLKFNWKAGDALAARASTTDVSGLFSLDHYFTLIQGLDGSHSLSFSVSLICVEFGYASVPQQCGSHRRSKERHSTGTRSRD